MTNYSSHNQRAIKFGKIGNEDYRLDNCTKDGVRTNEERDYEVNKFLKSNDFVFYYHRGMANYSKQISQ